MSYAPDKIQKWKWTKGNNSKSMKLSCALNFSSLRSIYLWSFMFMPCIVLKLCSRQNSYMKINKGYNSIITPKVWCLELWFLCTALLLNDIYLPTKFHVDALHRFKVMLRTKKGMDGQTDRWVDYYMPPFTGIKYWAFSSLILKLHLVKLE